MIFIDKCSKLFLIYPPLKGLIGVFYVFNGS